MKHSEPLNDLAAALVAAQAEMQPVEKGKVNPFFQSKYADFSAVKASATPVLTSHGLAVAQFPSHDDAGHDTLVSVLLHSSGQWMSDEMLLHPVKVDPQAQGSAITYAKRYAFMAILGLVADEDDDGNAASRSKPRAAAKPSSTRAARPAQPRTLPPDGAPTNPLNAYAIAIHKRAAELKIDPDVLDSILLGITGSTSANAVNRENRQAVLDAMAREAG